MQPLIYHANALNLSLRAPFETRQEWCVKAGVRLEILEIITKHPLQCQCSLKLGGYPWTIIVSIV